MYIFDVYVFAGTLFLFSIDHSDIQNKEKRKILKK